MGVTSAGAHAGQPIGRKVSIRAIDGNGKPSGGVVDVRIDGQPAGRIDLGTGSEDPISIEVSKPNSLIQVSGRFLGQEISVDLPPGEDYAELHFSGSARFAAGRRPLAHCPDGTTGSPCVQCRDASGATWEMCC
jgi:hypothetical protein